MSGASEPVGRRASLLATVGTHALLVLASIAALYPVLWVLKIALQPGQSFDNDPSPFPSSVSLEHFVEVTSTTTASGGWLFGRQLFNSLAVSGLTTAVGLLLATSAAYAFSRFRFAGREAGLTAFLLTQIFPGIVMLIPLYILLDLMGLLNALAGLVLVYSTTSVPFATWMLKGYFDTIPKELEEAARIDGASSFYIFSRIVLPLARPALAVTALFSFMTAWNEFILAATLMNDASSFTLPVALQRYVGEYQTDWGSFAAGAVIVSVPVMALFYALQRHLVGGLTAGAVKG
ncbi:MAG: sugar ABC transporter permease [Alphaproteobacteria bacterium]|nr:sugar ABC transporter permease [Alphaproteobacteria bacterium]